MVRVTTHEAKTQLSRLLSQVLEGDEVEILRGDLPVARLIPIPGPSEGARTRPRVGAVTSGKVRWTAESFAPLGADDLALWGLSAG